MSACEKGGQWEAALQLLRGDTDIIGRNAVISACGQSGQWRMALQLLSTSISANGISFSAAISACEKAWQWQVACALLHDMSQIKLEPNAPRRLKASELQTPR